MCPTDKTGPRKLDIRKHDEEQYRMAVRGEQVSKFPEESKPTDEPPSGNGSPDSTGRPGGPSPSDPAAPDIAPLNMSTKAGGVRMVRHHRGRSTISVGLLTRFQDLEPASFIALSGVGSAGVHTVTLSLELTRVQWESLERALTMPGSNVSVAVSFEPTTENLVPLITSPST